MNVAKATFSSPWALIRKQFGVRSALNRSTVGSALDTRGTGSSDYRYVRKLESSINERATSLSQVCVVFTGILDSSKLVSEYRLRSKCQNLVQIKAFRMTNDIACICSHGRRRRWRRLYEIVRKMSVLLFSPCAVTLLHYDYELYKVKIHRSASNG